MKNVNVAILGGGNIGSAIATGLVASGKYKPNQIILTRRRIDGLSNLKKAGFNITTDNRAAVKMSKYIFLCVRPDEVLMLLSEIKPAIKPKYHVVISVVT
ncbi:MAG: NAD(P)-binding domain-containing protein, partial [candidate division WOR-3 bacterium]|nr:NAD(P)-binding domain-containing protein [candidate division WOR-3 bacterium]